MTLHKEDSLEKIIEGFPNYKITSDGKVLSQYIPKTSKVDGVWREVRQVLCSGTGYLLVTLCHEGVRKNKRIHRLLMEAFVPNPTGKKHVNHKDGNKQNNALSNLEWATPKENSQHAVTTGLCEEVFEATRRPIQQLDPISGCILAEFISLHDAGRKTGIAWQNISKVVRGIRNKAGGYAWTYKNV